MFRAAGAALRTDQQIKELGELMIRRRLFIKADRMFKKPKPGKKRLVKWPHKLVPLYDDKARTLHSHSTPFLHWLEIFWQTHCAQCTSPTSMP